MNKQPRHILRLTTLSLAVGMLCLSSGTALAKHGKGHKRHRAKVMAKLNLSEAQKAEFKAMRQAHRAEKQAIRRDDTLSKQDKKAKLYALRQAKKAKMQSLLTPEQKAEHRELRAAHRAKKRNQRLERLERKLSLSADQKTRVSEILSEAAARGQGIHNQEGLSFEEHKAQIKAHRKQTRADLKAVLTPEQQERFAQMKRDRKGKRKGKGKRGRGQRGRR